MELITPFDIEGYTEIVEKYGDNCEAAKLLRESLKDAEPLLKAQLASCEKQVEAGYISKEEHRQKIIQAIEEERRLWGDNSIPKDRVREIHDYLDEYNNLYGTEECLCKFCGSADYDSKVGIVHLPTCIIIKLRELLGES